jgi:hypothetical protein
MPQPASTLILGALFYLGHVEASIRTLRGASPPGLFSLLYFTGTALVIATWIQADKHRLGAASTLDDGFFILLAWPLALPYHLFVSRGWRGGLALLGFLALYVLTYVMALLTFAGLRYLIAQLR